MSKLAAIVAAWLILLIAPRARAEPAYRGMSYVSFGANDLASSASDLSLENMRAVGTDTVALNFWWFQDTVNSNAMAEDFSRYSSTVSSIEHAIDHIHSLGMKVLLKPMLDVDDGTWRAFINPSNPDLWFTNYTNYLGMFADIAEAKGVDLFSIGCEMNALEHPAHNARWANLISNLRSRYSGALTYSANHSPAFDPDGPGPLTDVGGGFDAVGWWDQLDYIGIDAYFSIANHPNATLSELAAAWDARANSIEAWRNANHPTKQVIFTEVGYRSLGGSTQAPWGQDFGLGIDLQEQADAYEALLSVLSARSWWDGAFWWSWDTNPYAGGSEDTGFTPQNKPAQAVLQEFYGGPGPPPPPTGAPTQTLFSWETGLENWQVPNFHGRPASVEQSTEHPTAGDHSLGVTQTGDTFSWDAYVTLTGNALADFSLALADDPSRYRLEFDVTFDTDFIPQNSVTFMQVTMAINNSAGDWSQVDNVAATNGRTNETIHVDLPLTSFAGLAAGSSSYSLYLALNGNWGSGDATLFFDNVRLVNIDAPLTGDYNGDGHVDAGDYVAWRNALESRDLRADGNLNGVVDWRDYQLWKAHYGESLGGPGGGSLSVPEPAAGLLGLLATVFTIFSLPAGGGRRILLSSCSSALPSVCR